MYYVRINRFCNSLTVPCSLYIYIKLYNIIYSVNSNDISNLVSVFCTQKYKLFSIILIPILLYEEYLFTIIRNRIFDIIFVIIIISVIDEYILANTNKILHV